MNHAGLIACACRALLRNKARSLLTVLGITIGIAAVISVAAIAKAAQVQVERQMNRLGENYVWIAAGGRNVNGVETGAHAMPTLTAGDALAIARQVPLIKRVSPHVAGSAQVIYGGRNWNTVWRGVAPAYFDIKRWYPQQGALFTSQDVGNAGSVCVLGESVRERLFGGASPIGEIIRVGKLPCKVVAVLQTRGLALSGQDQDDQVILPYTTAQQKLKGNIWLNDIVGSALSENSVGPAGDEAAAVLRDRHHLAPGQGDDFDIRNPTDFIQARMAASRSLADLLLAVASVSLLVGGIGIMNVMLVSVSERTREIGLRVAVGASEGAIRFQFLGEALMLGLVGGAAGVLAGIIGSVIIGHGLGWAMEISPWSIAVALVFSSAVGLFFGYYPARKASLLNPAEALRHE